MPKIEFTIPVDSLTETTRKEAELKAKEAYIMILVKHGEISSGKAGKLLGISRLEVLELMSKYDLSPFDDSMSFEEFQEEINQAKARLGMAH